MTEQQVLIDKLIAMRNALEGVIDIAIVDKAFHEEFNFEHFKAEINSTVTEYFQRLQLHEDMSDMVY